jgi:recombinational DNA repair protein (RecF pathway)
LSKRSKHPSNKKLLELSADLALDLEAFCEAHYGAAAAEILRQALRRFIDAELKSEPKLRDRFLEARKRLGDSRARGIRLIHAGKSS